MKTGILVRRPMPMGDTERHSVVEFGPTSLEYLSILHGSKHAKWSFVAIVVHLQNAAAFCHTL